MSFWNWFKPSKPEPEPKQAEPRKAPDVDDWTPHHGNWVECESCHCGQKRREYIAWSMNPACHFVCPKCGHKDKWREFVGRSEWEESAARKEFYHGDYTDALRSRWRRNERFVEWTPDNCDIKDPE